MSVRARRQRLRRWMDFSLMASVALLLGLLLWTSEDKALATETLPRHLGYGISVGPHLPARPEMLSQMGLDWVKIYDTSQIDDYPNQNVLYRIDMRSLPDSSWESGIQNLTRVLAAAGVDAVEIGNEPNLGAEWETGPPNPEEFAQGLCRTYRAIKAVAPNMVVVSGGLAPTSGTADGDNMDDFSYARRMMAAGAGSCFDAYGYHPYGFNQPPETDPRLQPFSFRRAELMWSLVQSYGVIDKQMWITEWGWVRNPAEEGLDCSTSPAFSGFNWMMVSADVQAGYIARGWRFAEQNWPWAGPMFLWNLDWNTYLDPAYEDPCSHLRWYGVLDRDGSPLPAFYATQQVTKRAPLEYVPTVGARVGNMTQVVEAGCSGYMKMGAFTVYNSGYPGRLNAEILPANGPGRPFVSVSRQQASSRDSVDIFVDATGVAPGLHLIAVNLQAQGRRTVSTATVRGWLLVTYPSSPECITRYGAAASTPAP